MGDSGRTIRGRKVIKRTGLPRHVKDMSKEQLEATLRKKKECNAKALTIVEQMLDGVVPEEWFLSQLQYIDSGHFQDIVEERSICKLCGYPLCGEPLKSFSNQQYHISTKFNKVYDITERKKFCSNLCYKAAKFIQDQLLTSPLWLRDKEETPVFSLLPVGSKGQGTGEEVVFSINEDIKLEVKETRTKNFVSVADFTQASLSRMSRKIDEAEEKEKSKSQERDENKDHMPSVSEVDRENTVKPEDTEDHEVDRGNTVKPEDTKDQNEKGREKCVLNSNISREQDHSEDSKLNENVDDSKVNCQFSHLMERNEPIHCSENPVAEERADIVNSKLRRSCSANENCLSSALSSEEREAETLEHLSVHRCEKDKDFKKCNSSKASPVNLKTGKQRSKEQSRKQESEILVVNKAKNSIIYIEKCLYEWFTVDSMCFLFGEQKVKDMVCEKGQCIKEYYKAVSNSSWDPEIQVRYEALCRKLNLMELEDKQTEEPQEERPLKPLPDYKTLKEEALKMDLKIRAFYQGRLDFELPPNCLLKPSEELTPSCVLPLVDVHAQNALRRRMVLDNLKRALPDQLRTFGLVSRDISSDVRNLVTTFTLSAHNITFEPTEWSLVSLIIIKMLSIKDMRLKVLLESEQGTKYQTMMLMAVQQDGGYLDRLMVWLTDLDNIMKKQKIERLH